jgi:hypothetical protein
MGEVLNANGSGRLLQHAFMDHRVRLKKAPPVIDILIQHHASQRLHH